VLEIGCGTGQLTRSLLARGLRVTALEPGDQLIRVAEENLKDAGDVEFVHARLEDMQLPRESYEAVFSASAIHWVDPDLSWRKIADALAPNGTLALIQYFGLQKQRSVDDQSSNEDPSRHVHRRNCSAGLKWDCFSPISFRHQLSRRQRA
jgi:SAM-dependent methyltransferase